MIKIVYHPQPPERGFQRGNLDTAFSSKDKQKEKKILRSALQKPPFRGLAFSSKDKQKEKKILRSALQKPPFRGLGVVSEILQNLRLIFFNVQNRDAPKIIG